MTPEASTTLPAASITKQLVVMVGAPIRSAR
jgi:hypothetical protein